MVTFTGKFYWILLGQVLMSFAAPVFMSSNTLVCNKWFPTNELALANSISGLILPFGSIIAFVMVGYDYKGLSTASLPSEVLNATDALLWQ